VSDSIPVLSVLNVHVGTVLPVAPVLYKRFIVCSLVGRFIEHPGRRAWSSTITATATTVVVNTKEGEV
jgi:hypothetical protein